MSLDDVWSHAQNVTMWLNTATQSLGAGNNRSAIGFFANILSRGRSGNARVDEAIDAIGKARVAFVDLEFALHHAQLPQIQLASLKLTLAKSPDLGLVRFQINDANVAKLRETLARDLATVEQLVADVEARQRAPR
jgi:hypothetical protein